MTAPAPPPAAGPWAVQRQHSRYAVTLTAIYRAPAAPGGRVPPPRPAETANVSAEGACLLLPERIAPATALELMLRGQASHYLFRADVVWAGPTPTAPISHGVRLEPRSPQDRLAWERLLVAQQQQGSERALRIGVHLPAFCLVTETTSALPGEVQNLGRGGLRLVLRELLPAGTGVTVTIRSPLQELRLSGQVAWAKARPGERPAHGVAFSDPAAGRDALHQVVLAEFLLRVGPPGPAPSS